MDVVGHQSAHTTTKDAEVTRAVLRTKPHVNFIDLVWHDTTNTSVLFRRCAFKRLIEDAALAYRLLVFTVRVLKKKQFVNDLHIVKPTLPTRVTYCLQFGCSTSG